MTRQVQLRWLLGAVLGIAVAVCVGFLALPGLAPAPPELPVVVMDDYTPEDVRRFDRHAPPPAIAQPVPAPAELTPEPGPNWERAHDRADWIGGATVTCDIGHLVADARTAFLDMDQGVHLEGAVDVSSRFYSPVQDGRLTFTVRAMAGTTRVLVPDFERDMDPEDPHLHTRALRIRWSGAEVGSTVGCDGAWEERTGRLQVTLDGYPSDQEQESQARMVPPVLRGCGVMLPMPAETVSLSLATGRCVLQVERRHASLPFIVNRGERVAVDILPDRVTRVTLRVPDEPPLYQSPDLTELETAADLAAYFGSDAAADALETVVEKVASGEWNGESLAELLSLANPGGPVGRRSEAVEVGPDLSDEEVQAMIEREMAENPELMDEAMIQDSELIEAFADDVAAGGSIEQFPPRTRAAIEAELERRRDR